MECLLYKLHITRDEFIKSYIIIDHHKNKKIIEPDNTKLNKQLIIDEHSLSKFYNYSKSQLFNEDTDEKHVHYCVCYQRIINVWVLQNIHTLECIKVGIDCVYNLYPNSKHFHKLVNKLNKHFSNISFIIQKKLVLKI